MLWRVADAGKLLEEIRNAFGTGQYEISRHAAVHMLRRGIRTSEIEEAITLPSMFKLDFPGCGWRQSTSPTGGNGPIGDVGGLIMLNRSPL